MESRFAKGRCGWASTCAGAAYQRVRRSGDLSVVNALGVLDGLVMAGRATGTTVVLTDLVGETVGSGFVFIASSTP